MENNFKKSIKKGINNIMVDMTILLLFVLIFIGNPVITSIYILFLLLLDTLSIR